jgi:7,8-dihydropterin-6-yl-methyl-4-(beta-D-ribofuranosyl)aminobenzene 5'-phosphate synthase
MSSHIKGKQMRRISTIVTLLLATVAAVLAANSYLNLSNQRKEQIMNEENEATQAGVKNLTITVVYDNNPYKEGLETAWGFSCLVVGAEKTILFDTGGDGLILLGNMEKLGIEPNSIDTVVLSHIHGDHTGGLNSFLEKNDDVTVYLPKSFPKKFKDNVTSFNSKIIEVEQPLKICENVYSGGELGKWIQEQSLIVRTDKGIIVITGCAHPGIVKIVNTAKGLLRHPALREPKDDILLVMGGFHLEWATKGKIEKIISAFKQIGVRYVGPSHCSGHKARTLFEKHFGTNYINVGAGKVITAVDLQ